MTPTRNLSTVSRSIPASIMASSEATSAYWANLSSFLASLRSKKSSTLKFLSSQANLVLNFSVSKYVTGAEPLLPFTKPSQYSSILFPIGVSAPKPVTTTRFNSIEVFYFLFFCVLDIRNCLTNSCNVFCLIVWDLNIEFFFEFHDQLYRVQ